MQLRVDSSISKSAFVPYQAPFIAQGNPQFLQQGSDVCAVFTIEMKRYSITGSLA
ncbi:hypothetical protein KTT_38160 [Tengunoibacter tsumagoiensis]|uniref:Uncharacterized protein n=1 Tax=Tengunoibacter tsumagoiensis TaxID=2014871 RepID=A0A402A487_9CHLR|nr:hypothetical protein KTT_38160 [Tengunoibacter tsumagoiensis]